MDISVVEENLARDGATVPPSGIITLLSDFGNADGYVAAMKGVMLSLNPHVRFVDLSHEIPPQHVFAAGLLLATHFAYFPRGTVHVAIVDPGVGTARAALACIFSGHYFVAPDNGLLDFCAEHAAAYSAVNLSRSEYWRPVVSATFHGRDIFAPVAAHLTRGTPLSELGEPIQLELHGVLEAAEQEADRLIGKIVYIDHFGNLISNVSAAALTEFCGAQPYEIRVADLSFSRLHASYGHVGVGEAVALLNSFARLEISVNQGHAASRLNLQLGTPIIVTRGVSQRHHAKPRT